MIWDIKDIKYCENPQVLIPSIKMKKYKCFLVRSLGTTVITGHNKLFVVNDNSITIKAVISGEHCLFEGIHHHYKTGFERKLSEKFIMCYTDRLEEDLTTEIKFNNTEEKNKAIRNATKTINTRIRSTSSGQKVPKRRINIS